MPLPGSEHKIMLTFVCINCPPRALNQFLRATEEALTEQTAYSALIILMIRYDTNMSESQSHAAPGLHQASEK